MSEKPYEPALRSPRTDGRRTAAAIRRREREKQILDATRALFDERGVRDAQIEDIAKAVGTNRAIIYRHFSGKEELFALTLAGYLDELHVQLEAQTQPDPVERLDALVTTFVDFGMAHPAFVDCAQTLMRRTGPELLDEINESALFRLGRSISSCLSTLVRTFDEGVEKGVFDIEDTTLLANHLYATGLGALQLARVGMLIKEAAPGIPAISRLSGDQVRRFLVATARALALTRP
jgi:AcrR family transcriptional regulator